MANAFFKFKQFTVYQNHAAMKVSTDACVFGGIIVQRFQELLPSNSSVLDIGAGTGLLSLMLKQGMEYIKIDAVEIDDGAVIDAQYNFEQSPWKHSLTLHHQDIQYFQNDTLYDAVICNPPFFDRQLKNPETQKLKARHTDYLSWSALIEAAFRLSKEEAYWAVLLPIREWNEFSKLLGEQWSIRECHYIQPFINKKPNRVVIVLQKGKNLEPSKVDIRYWSIYQAKGIYTEQFNMLLSDYYLYL